MKGRQVELWEQIAGFVGENPGTSLVQKAIFMMAQEIVGLSMQQEEAVTGPRDTEIQNFSSNECQKL